MYTSITQILTELSQEELVALTNDENRPAAEIDLEDSADLIVVRINGVITVSDAEIDGYLQGRYTLPLTAVPVTIADISTQITIYRLFRRRHRKNLPEDIIISYNNAVKLLGEIQKGNVNPGIEESTSQADTIIKTNADPNNRIFTDDYMSDF